MWFLCENEEAARGGKSTLVERLTLPPHVMRAYQQSRAERRATETQRRFLRRFELRGGDVKASQLTSFLPGIDAIHSTFGIRLTDTDISNLQSPASSRSHRTLIKSYVHWKVVGVFTVGGKVDEFDLMRLRDKSPKKNPCGFAVTAACGHDNYRTFDCVKKLRPYTRLNFLLRPSRNQNCNVYRELHKIQRFVRNAIKITTKFGCTSCWLLIALSKR